MSWEPKYSRKERPMKDTNCGQHCVAMVTHLPVGVIEAFLGTRRGTTFKQITGACRWFGLDCDVSENKFIRGMTLPKLCLIHTSQHFSVYFDGKIYCPDIGIWNHEPNSPKFLKSRILSYFKIEIPTI